MSEGKLFREKKKKYGTFVPRDLKSILGRKIRNSNFRPKIDPEGQKSIFGEKVESVIFQPKLSKKWSLKVSNRFLVEK